MGVLKRFEQRLEGLVNGTFAKVFKSEVQPVEIAGALQRECDNNATIWNRDRTVVPNDFIVELSTPDYERLSPYAGQLGEELSGDGPGLRQAAALHLHGPGPGPPGAGRRPGHRAVPGAQPHAGLQRVPAAGPRRSASRARPARGGPQQARTARRLRLPVRSPPPPRRCPPARAGVRVRRDQAARHRRTRRRTPGAGSRSTATATRSPARRWCSAAAPRPTCGSTTRASPAALRDPGRIALDGPGPRLHQRHRGRRTAHPARYAPRRLADRRGQHHHRLPASRRVKRGQCQS